MFRLVDDTNAPAARVALIADNTKDSLRFNTLRYEVTRDNIKQALHSASSASSL